MAGSLSPILLTMAILVAGEPSWAFTSDLNSSMLLEQRQQAWPEWKLPAPLTRPQQTDDLVYPSWFEGNWQVESINVDSPDQPAVQHYARFQSDGHGRIVADRSFNAASIGKALLGDRLVLVKDNPSSANYQVAKLKDNLRMETNVIGRRQANLNDNTFLADELVLQILHSSSPPRISQVETLSRYQQRIDNDGRPWICAEQWQARYPGPESVMRRLAISTNHYRLCLKPLPGTAPSV